MKFTEAHLKLMLDFRNRIRKFHTLSATKQKLVMELMHRSLMRQDNEDFIYNSEFGDTLLDNAITYTNNMLSLILTQKS